jgi:hypothetical protein
MYDDLCAVFRGESAQHRWVPTHSALTAEQLLASRPMDFNSLLTRSRISPNVRRLAAELRGCPREQVKHGAADSVERCLFLLCVPQVPLFTPVPRPAPAPGRFLLGACAVFKVDPVT